MSEVTRRETSLILLTGMIGSGMTMMSTGAVASYAGPSYVGRRHNHPHPYFVSARFYRKLQHVHVWVNLVHVPTPTNDVPFYSAVAHTPAGASQIVSKASVSAAAANHTTYLRMKLPVIPQSSNPLYCCVGVPVSSAALQSIRMGGTGQV